MALWSGAEWGSGWLTRALRRDAKGGVLLDREACWGCGTCRAGCHRKALTLESRSATADVAMRW